MLPEIHSTQQFKFVWNLIISSRQREINLNIFEFELNNKEKGFNRLFKERIFKRIYFLITFLFPIFNFLFVSSQFNPLLYNLHLKKSFKMSTWNVTKTSWNNICIKDVWCLALWFYNIHGNRVKVLERVTEMFFSFKR